MTLSDTDDDTLVTTPELAAEPIEVTERHRVILNIEAGTIELEGKTFDAKVLPGNSLMYCSLIGLTLRLRSSKDADAAYAALLTGNTPHREKGPKVLPLWREAAALTLVESTRKSDAPVSLEEARTKALALPKDKLAMAKLDPAVVRQYRKLTGAVLESVSELFG